MESSGKGFAPDILTPSLLMFRTSRLTFRLTRAARSDDTPERGDTRRARARLVRRVQPGVIRLVERGLLTDEAHDDGSGARFTPGRRATRAAPSQLRARN